MLQNQDWNVAKKHGRLVAKAWVDPALNERLVADPAAVLREHGFDVPDGIEVRLVEQTEGTVVYDDGVIYFAMPALPSREFGDESLDGDVIQAYASAHTSSSGPHTSSGGCVGCIVQGKAE
jgi:hypothetical protein